MKRLKDDAYLTEPPLAHAIVRHLSYFIAPETVLEPSSGEGHFVHAVRTRWPTAHITSVDVRSKVAKKNRVSDKHIVGRFEDCSFEKTFDLAVGNPPFSLAEEHIKLARLAAVHVAFLLRMSFLGSQGRAQRLWRKPGLWLLIPLAERPSFIGGKTDNSEYGVFVWKQGYVGKPMLDAHLWVNEGSS